MKVKIFDESHEKDLEDAINKFIENRCFCKDKTFKWLEWSCKYIEEQEIFLVTARDITDRKEREAEKGELEKAIHIESMKSEFFANISHEFKTPLNIILATMQIINKNIEEKSIIHTNEVHLNRYMNSIKQNCYRLLRLVNNIIDISKIENGYYNIDLGNYNIVSIVEDMTMSVIEYAKEKGINLIFDTEIEEEIIACDPEKIERIILNLLSNAIKYTEKNGTINVNIYIKDDNINISIADNGIGIPNEKLKSIFERYTQIDNKLTRKYNGSGIGLSLVKSLVELQGGKISVESKVNEGSKFTLKFPIIKVKNESNIKKSSNLVNSRVEKCNIEFSDIYQ